MAASTDPGDIAPCCDERGRSREIDRRLRAEIGERQRYRERVGELAAGDRLVLPPEAVAYLDRLRELGIPERAVTMERDAWILVAAQIPAQMPVLMALKRGHIEDPAVVSVYFDLVEAADWAGDDPRLLAVAERLVAMFEEEAESWTDEQLADFALDEELVALLDEVFVNAVPVARFVSVCNTLDGWPNCSTLTCSTTTNRSRPTYRPHTCSNTLRWGSRTFMTCGDLIRCSIRRSRRRTGSW